MKIECLKYGSPVTSPDIPASNPNYECVRCGAPVTAVPDKSNDTTINCPEFGRAINFPGGFPSKLTKFTCTYCQASIQSLIDIETVSKLDTRPVPADYGFIVEETAAIGQEPQSNINPGAWPR